MSSPKVWTSYLDLDKAFWNKDFNMDYTRSIKNQFYFIIVNANINYLSQISWKFILHKVYNSIGISKLNT